MIPSYHQGQQGFFKYYRSLFSTQDAFEDCFKNLHPPTLPILRFNPCNEHSLKELWAARGLPWKTLDWYPHALLWPEAIPPGTMLPGYEEHLFYPMNASSLLPVLALDVRHGETILDACAAPGGKALFIGEQLSTSGRLVANDASPERGRRLRQILIDYGFSGVEVWHRKAEILFKIHPDAFDKILLDAPCSSEKHVLSSPTHLARWSYGRIRQLKQRQIALLSGLFLALKPGGRLVYSTCALTPEENEEVVGLFLKKKKGQAKLLPWSLPELPGGPGIDLTSVRRVWPDGCLLDPMFVAVFEKIACSL